jgi:hypothetical protein
MSSLQMRLLFVNNMRILKTSTASAVYLTPMQWPTFKAS